jgi:hypothetical protein
VSRQRESKMKKATYEQLVTVAAKFAKNNNCSYAIAAKLYKVAEEDVLAFQWQDENGKISIKTGIVAAVLN